ncbi:MAG: hypothetical protein ACJ786_20160 [Catenulispora sp.]|jgi:hypothetical protein
MFPTPVIPHIDLPFGSDRWFPRDNGQIREMRDWTLRNAITGGRSDEDIERATVTELAAIIEAQFAGGFSQFAIDHRHELFGGPGGDFRP